MIQEICESLDATNIDKSPIKVQWKDAINLVHDAFLPKLQLGEDRPITCQDFARADNDKRLAILLKLCDFLASINDLSMLISDRTLMKAFLSPLLILCSENLQASHWSNSQHIECGYRIIGILKTEVFKKNSIAELLLENPQFLGWCLRDQLHCKLTKQDWKSYPGARTSFAWLLRQICEPHLSKYLSEFLPFTLTFLDDWEIKHKAFALHCLDHIVDNLSQTELLTSGYSEVIKSALFHALNFRDTELVSIAYECCFKFTHKCEGPKTQFAKFDTWDDLAKKLLYSLETETKIELKRIYASLLSNLLTNIQEGAIRWMTSILGVISTHLTESSDHRLRRIALQNLLLVLELCEQRVKFHAEVIFEALVRLLYELRKVPEKSADDDELFQTAARALKLAAKIASEEFSLLFDGIELVAVDESFDQVMRECR